MPLVDRSEPGVLVRNEAAQLQQERIAEAGRLQAFAVERDGARPEQHLRFPES